MANNRLSDYGHVFQVKSISCLMIKPDFMEQVFDILDETLYDNDALKWIVKQCKEYFNEYITFYILFDVGSDFVLF